MTTRSSGVLLHPTSLPGRHGVGDLGAAADRWLGWLERTGCTYWQVLPLGPTGYADSPYQSFSSFAGNPLLISPEGLVNDGLLGEDDVLGPDLDPDRVDYGAAIAWKDHLLRLAFSRFGSHHPLAGEFAEFCDSAAAWLEDYALFMALKGRHDLRPWSEWPPELRDRDPHAVAAARADAKAEIELRRFQQWLFARQWMRLRRRAHERSIRIIGDLPLYVAHDSVDVWVDRELFDLHPDGRPATIAGVPPDYFSESGQRWGNPIYDWEAHARQDYAWWIARLAATLDTVDVVRIDHFRGIADYWVIPAEAPTAITGRWVDGPGHRLFDALEGAIGKLPIIAEDLGYLSETAHRLLAELGYPGMKILQFAFDTREEGTPFTPDQIGENTAVYTGTHDNDTTAGWFVSLDDQDRARVLEMVGGDGTDIAWRLVEAVWGTRGFLAVAPLQDLLGLPTEARMNEPGTTAGNWRWRFRDHQLDDGLADRLAALNRQTGRDTRGASAPL